MAAQVEWYRQRYYREESVRQIVQLVFSDRAPSAGDIVVLSELGNSASLPLLPVTTTEDGGTGAPNGEHGSAARHGEGSSLGSQSGARRFHVYTSRLNAGAESVALMLADELASSCVSGGEITPKIEADPGGEGAPRRPSLPSAARPGMRGRVLRLTSVESERVVSWHFLLYLNRVALDSLSQSSPPRALNREARVAEPDLASEIRDALAEGVHVLLVQEGREGAGAVTEFAEVIAATPADLVAAGLYNEIAYLLTDGQHLHVSLKLLARGVGQGRQPNQAMTLRRCSHLARDGWGRLQRVWQRSRKAARWAGRVGRRVPAAHPDEILLGYTEPRARPASAELVAPPRIGGAVASAASWREKSVSSISGI